MWGKMKKSLFAFLCFLQIPFLTTSSLHADNTENNVRVVIFGDAWKEEDGRGIDEEALTLLLERIKAESPDTVFFTGNLIQGLEQSTSQASIKQFQSNMNTFSNLVKATLGKEIPLYSVMGNHTFVNSQAVSTFREHFAIENTAPLESYQFAYSVLLNNSQFVVLASGGYERKFRGYRHYLRQMPLFDWLEKQLRTGSDRIDYRFVIGHEPAYSSGFSAGEYKGMDKNPERRDLFWKILRQNGALGYFCSHEFIFDRSNREGVWQVITGGVDLSADEDLEKKLVFHHYLLLTIPKEKNGNPIIQAKDLKGRIWDEFELVPLDRPVHQLRISSRR